MSKRRAPVDDFNELPELRAKVVKAAENNHHDLGRFRVRPNDATKLNAFCHRCGAIAVINLDPDGQLPPIYGVVLRTMCQR